MNDTIHNDVVLQQAMDWVLLEHENALDSDQRQALGAWLKAFPEHVRAYQEMRDLWLITGLLPTPDEISGSDTD